MAVSMPPPGRAPIERTTLMKLFEDLGPALAEDPDPERCRWHAVTTSTA
jgi:hypothetical protein